MMETNQQVPTTSKQTLVRELPPASSTKHTIKLVLASFIVVFTGLGSGWLLSNSDASDSDQRSSLIASGTKEDLSEAGLADESLFEDVAPEGILAEGGINGEGTHYLDRGLGEEKNVYLTSTLLDLQSFVGKKVQVWGNTIAAQDAPWLMDVGKLKVVE